MLRRVPTGCCVQLLCVFESCGPDKRRQKDVGKICRLTLGADGLWRWDESPELNITGEPGYGNYGVTTTSARSERDPQALPPPLDHCTFKNAPVGQLRFLKVQWSEVEFGEEEGVPEGLALTSQIPDFEPPKS
jgi:hypothetical protein